MENDFKSLTFETKNDIMKWYSTAEQWEKFMFEKRKIYIILREVKECHIIKTVTVVGHGFKKLKLRGY